jgi:uncharacterized protein (DUF1778 family)
MGVMRTPRDQTINIRVSRQQRDVIDLAAQTLGKSRSDFMVETAYREAEQVLLDRTVFTLDEQAFAEFEAMLDTPPAPTQGLRKLLTTKAPWE